MSALFSWNLESRKKRKKRKQREQLKNELFYTLQGFRQNKRIEMAKQKRKIILNKVFTAVAGSSQGHNAQTQSHQPVHVHVCIPQYIHHGNSTTLTTFPKLKAVSFNSYSSRLWLKFCYKWKTSEQTKSNIRGPCDSSKSNKAFQSPIILWGKMDKNCQNHKIKKGIIFCTVVSMGRVWWQI